MRRRFIAPALALCLLLSACGGEEAGMAVTETAYSAGELTAAIWQSQEDRLPPMAVLTPEDEDFGAYLTAYYRLSPEDVEDGCLRYAGGMEAGELAVLRFTQDADMAAAEEALLAYQDARAGDFTGYLPEQAELVESGRVVIQGRWAALLLCPDPEAAQETFLSCFGPDAPAPSPQDPGFAPAELPPETAGPAPAEEPETPEPPEELPADRPETLSQSPARPEEPAPQPPAEAAASDAYDHDAVAAAYRGGGSAGLSEKNRAVLDAAKSAISQVLTDGMSDYEKELAIHDWMLAWGTYDHGTLSHLSGEEPGADSGNPYGFLVDRAGICLGYASTFQLFMDLLGIECLTVEGTAHNGTADHAWNLVRLDGAWYGVDVTWDDPTTALPVSDLTAHRYFNVTSEFLRANDHQWTAAVPEAEGTAWAWSGGAAG